MESSIPNPKSLTDHNADTDTAQRIAFCDSCQLTIAWMPKIKEVAMVTVLLS